MGSASSASRTGSEVLSSRPGRLAGRPVPLFRPIIWSASVDVGAAPTGNRRRRDAVWMARRARRCGAPPLPAYTGNRSIRSSSRMAATSSAGSRKPRPEAALGAEARPLRRHYAQPTLRPCSSSTRTAWRDREFGILRSGRPSSTPLSVHATIRPSGRVSRASRESRSAISSHESIVPQRTFPDPLPRRLRGSLLRHKPGDFDLESPDSCVRLVLVSDDPSFSSGAH